LQQVLKPIELNCRYSLNDSFDLSPVSFFDKFVIESKNGVLILHLKDWFGSLYCCHCDYKFWTNMAFLAVIGQTRIFRFWATKNLQP